MTTENEHDDDPDINMYATLCGIDHLMYELGTPVWIDDSELLAEIQAAKAEFDIERLNRAIDAWGDAWSTALRAAGAPRASGDDPLWVPPGTLESPLDGLFGEGGAL